MPPTDRHPIIAEIVAACEKRGAAVYAGDSFVVATWPNGDRLEARIDRETPPVVCSPEDSDD